MDQVGLSSVERNCFMKIECSFCLPASASSPFGGKDNCFPFGRKDHYFMRTIIIGFWFLLFAVRSHSPTGYIICCYLQQSIRRPKPHLTTARQTTNNWTLVGSQVWIDKE